MKVFSSFLVRSPRTAVSIAKLSSVSRLNDVEYHKKAKEIIRDFADHPRRTSELILSRDTKHADTMCLIRVPGNDKTVVYCIDDFVSDTDCSIACGMLKESELQSFIMSPGERTVSADTYLLEDIISSRAAAVIDHFKHKMHSFAESTTKLKLKEAGTLLSWLSPPSSTHKNVKITELMKNIVSNSTSYNYWHAHCDKANNKEYDLSDLLYLNNDYTGGSLIFMDPDGNDREIQPTAGRLLMFHSCLDNIHRIEPVISGNRFLLSVWYSLS